MSRGSAEAIGGPTAAARPCGGASSGSRRAQEPAIAAQRPARRPLSVMSGAEKSPTGGACPQARPTSASGALLRFLLALVDRLRVRELQVRGHLREVPDDLLGHRTLEHWHEHAERVDRQLRLLEVAAGRVELRIA